MSTISQLSIRFQQKAYEEVRSLGRLSQKQEEIIADKRALNDLHDLLEKYESDGFVSAFEIRALEERLGESDIASAALEEFKRILVDANNVPDSDFARAGDRQGLWIEGGEPGNDWDDQRRDLLEKVRGSIDRKREEANDSDDLVSFKIQYHWGNYSNYTQTASTLEKREDEHGKGIIQNI